MVPLAGVTESQLPPEVVEDDTVKLTFSPAGTPAKVNVCGFGGAVPVTQLNWVTVPAGTATASAGAAMGVKGAAWSEAVGRDAGFCSPVIWSMCKGAVASTRTAWF